MLYAILSQIGRVRSEAPNPTGYHPTVPHKAQRWVGFPLPPADCVPTFISR